MIGEILIVRNSEDLFQKEEKGCQIIGATKTDREVTKKYN
jgi:hypothetical protein